MKRKERVPNMVKQAEEPAKSTATGDKAEPPPRVIVILIMVSSLSLFALVVTASILLSGPFPSRQGLYYIYFGYAFSVVVFLHAAFFAWNSFVKHRGQALSKNVPRYLEYAYAALISIGLSQVVYMSSELYEYIGLSAGTDAELVERIREQASSHVKDDCPKGGEYFPAGYCEKLRGIVGASVPSAYVNSSVIGDDEFLDHAIRRDAVGGGPAGF